MVKASGRWPWEPQPESGDGQGSGNKVSQHPAVLAKISRTSGLPCLASLDLTSPPFLPQVVEVEGFFLGCWLGPGLGKATVQKG